jgi:superfamily II DNA or RNA helicase
MEHATLMHGVSFKKKPRSGQARVFDALSTHREKLNIKFPTAYGKTFVCAGVYSILSHQARCNRLLIIFPSLGQLRQFCNDGPGELDDAGVAGPAKVIDISFSGTVAALREHRNNTCQIFAITVQALREARGMDACQALTGTGQWMICVDEYHHYGEARSWGLSVLALQRAFLLAMSATPYRPDDDSAFGPPDISMTYREAWDEKSVKPLRGHAYTFSLDVTVDDQQMSFTTKEFAEMAGGDDPERIEKLKIQRRMRWSPKYVSPLVRYPIWRMQDERSRTGKHLQVLIGAMCVSHAEFVCEQLRGMFEELTIDWVGTGTDGRSQEDNERVLAAFCPQKDENGNRPRPSIDVLVHVGMAGEGLDSINVSEIVFLNRASICNRKIQEIGRGARYIEGVTATVNFDSSSEFATEKYTGESIMDAMDYQPPRPSDDEPSEPRDEADALDEMPDEPDIKIFNLELTSIDSGNEGVRHMALVLSTIDPGRFSYTDLMRDSTHADWEIMVGMYKTMRTREAAEFNERSTIHQWRDQVATILNQLTRRVIKLVSPQGPVPSELIGRIKRKINARKKGLFGEIDARRANDLETLKKHYHWCRQLERDIIANGLPSWLP